MNIDMLNNGVDSLKRGFSSYLEYSETVKEKRSPSLDDYYVLKQAVLSTHHGVEILLKCILNKKSEFLIVDEMDPNYKSAFKEKIEKKYQSVFQTSKASKIHTITYEEALSRVKYFCDVELSEELERKLKDLNTVRNALTHAEAVIDDSFIDGVFDSLLLDLDVLFLKAIGNTYSSFYGYSEIKANYDSYMQYLEEHKMTIKEKALNALFSAQEKTEQYSGQKEIIYVEEIAIVKKFMVALQKDLDFGMDMYNGWCSGKTKVKIKPDGHISFWAADNNGEYIFKFKSMILYIPEVTSNESPIVIFEADDDTVEPEYQEYVSAGMFDYLEGICFPTDSEDPDVVIYDPKKIHEFYMRCEYDDEYAIPQHYEIDRFLKRRVFGCLNIQGLSYWKFGELLRRSENMTGSELADRLKELLRKRS